MKPGEKTQIKTTTPILGISAYHWLDNERFLYSSLNGELSLIRMRLDSQQNTLTKLKVPSTFNPPKDKLYFSFLNDPKDGLNLYCGGLGTIDKLSKSSYEFTMDIFKLSSQMELPSNLFFMHLAHFNNIKRNNDSLTDVLLAVGNRGTQTYESSLFLFDLTSMELLAEMPLHFPLGKVTAAHSRGGFLVLCICYAILDEDHKTIKKYRNSLYLLDEGDIQKIAKKERCKTLLEKKSIINENLSADRYTTVVIDPICKYVAVGSYDIIDFYKIDKKNNNVLVLALSVSTKFEDPKRESSINIKISALDCEPLRESEPKRESEPQREGKKFSSIFAIACSSGYLAFFNIKKRTFSKFLLKSKSDFDLFGKSFVNVSWSPNGKILMYEKNEDWKFGKPNVQAEKGGEVNQKEPAYGILYFEIGARF